MSKFVIYPAIDIRDGNCVRLIQGDYDQETVYGNSPLEMAKRFAEAGAEWIHTVDLDGAKAGKRVNHEHVIAIAKNLDVKVQVGGGIRTPEDVAAYLDNGVDRVILGSSAIKDPQFVKEMLKQYGEKIAIGIDARDGYVATEGWLETSKVTAEALGIELATHGAEVFIFTDISRDGMLSGPNTEAIAALARATGKEVIASGGVSKLDDLTDLKKYENDGIGGAIIGKALYTNQFTLAEALERGAVRVS
jgi:phosphoribosylformimino-5-aminoimidazole carboxamide ribotide isomerase